MYPYWLLFTFFAIGSLTARSRLGPSDRFRSFGFLAGFILLTVMIGLRDQIGLDWNKYEYFFTMVARKSLLDVLLMRDPAYFLLDWAAQQLDAPFWVANSVGALIFNWGLYRFARTQPEPWLVVLAAIPYLVIVVAMGMARQGIAIGILLGGLAGLIEEKPFRRFIIAILVAAMFHSSAVVALPISVLGLKRSRATQLIAVPAVAYFLYTFAFQNDFDVLVANYVTNNLESEGAAVRLALCAVPAIAFLLYKRRLAFGEDEQALWRNYSIVALGLVTLYFFIPASTAIDRSALYLLPLQLAIFSRMPLLVGSWLLGRLIVIFLTAAVLFVWLNYAKSAFGWVPYRMTIPFA